jgi:hypothetical protein
MALTTPTPPAELLASLEKHNAAFTKLLSLIPSRYYLPVDQDEVSESESCLEVYMMRFRGHVGKQCIVAWGLDVGCQNAKGWQGRRRSDQTLGITP